ncbi:MAG: hypothetical protein H0V89_03495 [Deltaproteobacteria bacterium]|nr:hypothetical protein [Deltaproteobacteria bacterium]
MRRIETYDFWRELLSLKDDLSLRELAERFNVTPGAISAAFKRTGTARLPAPPGPRALRQRGGFPDDEIEISFRGPVGDLVRPGSKDHLLAPWRGDLGRVPDAEVAERAGVSVRTVASFRARNAIPGYTGPRRVRRDGDERHAWRIVIRHEGNDREGVVLAETLAEAAAQVQLPGGRLVSVTWLGELLSPAAG